MIGFWQSTYLFQKSLLSVMNSLLLISCIFLIPVFISFILSLIQILKERQKMNFIYVILSIITVILNIAIIISLFVFKNFMNDPRLSHIKEMRELNSVLQVMLPAYLFMMFSFFVLSLISIYKEKTNRMVAIVILNILAIIIATGFYTNFLDQIVNFPLFRIRR
jgi:uncharacterized membrane protein YoaK (UPF0700 family)